MSDHGLTPDMAPVIGGERPTQTQIDRAVAAVRRICGWHVWPVRTETMHVDGSGDRDIFLPTKHLVGLEGLTINGEDINIDDVSFSEDGMVYRKQGFPCGLRNISVTITHGYEEAPELAGVVLEMASRATRPSGNLSVGGISVGASSGLTPQSSEWRIVDLYRLGPLP